MARAMIDSSGNVPQDLSATWTSGTTKTLPEVAPERLIMAVAMYFRDELNALRADPLTILGARSLDDVINGIKAKLT
jgi:hypothetical protein